jgi:hypothetical protein
MPEQLPLRYDPRFSCNEAWEGLLERVRSVVRHIGLKQVAYDLDVQPSVLAHALAERERHYLRMEWLPYFVTNDPGIELVEHIAAWRGLYVEPKHEITDEEWRARVEGALSTMPEFADVIRKKAGV